MKIDEIHEIKSMNLIIEHFRKRLIEIEQKYEDVFKTAVFEEDEIRYMSQAAIYLKKATESLTKIEEIASCPNSMKISTTQMS